MHLPLQINRRTPADNEFPARRIGMLLGLGFGGPGLEVCLGAEEFPIGGTRGTRYELQHANERESSVKEGG